MLARAVFSCSLLMLLTALLWAGDFTSLGKQMRAAHSSADAVSLVKNDRAASTYPDIAQALQDAEEANTPAERQRSRDHLQSLVELRALPEGASPATDASTA